jgi:ribosomal protein S18 acetylase RimI-like enzyme
MSTVKKGELNIRPMERKDVDVVLAIDRRSSPTRSILTRRELTAYDPGGAFDLSFVAEVNSKVVGFVLARLTYVGMPVTEVGVIHTLVIDPEHRRQGISTRLLSALSSCCETEGIGQLRAVVNERDPQLKSFFEKLGFRRSELINYIKTFGC